MSAARSFGSRAWSAGDRDRFWFWDPSHFPRPVTPAAETLDLPAMAAGFARAAAELRRPLPGQYVRTEHGFVYFGLDTPPSAEALARAEAAYAETVARRLDGALTSWTEQYAPAADRLTEEIRRLAKVGSDATLAEALDAAVALRAEQWRIHDLALVPAMEAATRFTSRYGELLGGAIGAHALLQGFPNRATAAAEALEALAESVRARPHLATLLTARRITGMDEIPGSADGRWFRDALAAYLDVYGQRTGAWDVGDPTWAEEPGPVFVLLREGLARAAAAPGAHRREAAARREHAVRSALASLPESERGSFAAALRAAQAYPVVSEDHNALIDQQGMAALRAVVLEVGSRLAARGALRCREDAVWLSRDELAQALLGTLDPRRLPPARLARHHRRLALSPPRTIGAPLPEWAVGNPTLADFFGLRAEPSAAGDALRGAGVSPGTASGRACVVHSLDEIEALEPGDILVCRMTSPAWTPWLGLIAGAVVETGGMLSHTAVLAREYGVPCVANVREATRIIPDGSRIEIDGASGLVRWSGPAHARKAKRQSSEAPA